MTLLGSLATVFGFTAVVCATDAPHWWTARGVLDPRAAPNDFAPANQGQAKWIAVQAAAELDRRLPHGAGSTISGIVAGFSTDGGDRPLNLGQLKSLAAPFYDRIRAEGFADALPPGQRGPYPWTANPADDNDFAMVNVGQLKHVFSFDLDLCFDSDGDGLPDGVELRWGLNPDDPSDADKPSTQPFAHGLSHRQVHRNPSVLRASDYSTLNDGIPDWWKVERGFDVNDVHLKDLDGDGDGRTTLREYQYGSSPFWRDEMIWLRRVRTVTKRKEGFEEFQRADPPRIGMYLRSVTTWTDWIEPSWQDLDPLGPGGVAETYDVRTEAWRMSRSGVGVQLVGPSRVHSATRMSGSGEVWSSCRSGNCVMDDAGMWWCAGHRGTQAVEVELSEAFTTAMLLDHARASMPGFAGDFQPTDPDFYDGLWYDPGSDPIGDEHDAAWYDLSADERDVTAGAIEYKFRLESSPGMRSVSWVEIFVPKDQPETPEDESAALEYTFRQWPDATSPDTGGDETPVYTLDPLAAGSPRPGQYRILVFPPGEIVPDFNRDGRINDDDRLSRMGGKRLRIWINDDRDAGDMSGDSFEDAPVGSFEPDAMPGSIGIRLRNCMDGQVNGLRDLVDFFPVYLDIPLDRFPPGDYTYTLRQDDSAVQYAYTSLTPGDAGRIHTGIVSNCGAKSDVMLADAPTHWTGPPSPWSPAPSSSAGIRAGPLDPDWIKEHRVLLIEGVKASPKPLVLEIKREGILVLACQMPLSVSPVRDMFRYLNVRTNDLLFTSPDQTFLWSPGSRECAKVGPWGTSLAEPTNYPDGYYSPPGSALKTLVGIHGVNWDHNETPAGHAELFKRFFQSGCHARYIGVSWASDCGRRAGLPMVYYTDVIGAFVSAHYVKKGLEGFLGPDTAVFAHSLGNILASSMIVDHGAGVGKYFMVNAAVPIEAYDGAHAMSNAVAMMPLDWTEPAEQGRQGRYGPIHMAARWHTQFSPGDPRSAVGWDNRFGALAHLPWVYDFHSTGEDVLAQPTGEVPFSKTVMGELADRLDAAAGFDRRIAADAILRQERVWVYSEMTKGDPAFLANLLLLRRVHGGWGFRFPAPGLSKPIEEPIFRAFESADARCPAWGRAEDWIYRPDGHAEITERLPALPFTAEPVTEAHLNKIKNHAKLLAEAIPSLSGPAGGFPLRTVKSHDMQIECRDASFWPGREDQRNKRGRWLHGDYKAPAYPYVYRLYDLCTQLIQGETP